MSAPRDLLRAQLDRDARFAASLVGRIARWLSSDARAVGRLRHELDRCRLTHAHEVGRLRTLLDGRTFRALDPQARDAGNRPV